MNEIHIQQGYLYFFQPEVIQPAIEVSESTTGQVTAPVSVSAYKKATRLQKLSKILAGFGVFFVILYFAPSVFASLSSGSNEWVIDPNSVIEEQNEQVRYKNLAYQPPVDSKLPLGAHLRIPKIKVNTSLIEKDFGDHEEALAKGVWRVNDFGTPYDRVKPTILAAHRFGYLKWDNAYRRTHSFYNLPKLQDGDIVEIIWRQRKYTYEIYASTEGVEIEDYSADLILYTCRDLNSDIKYFKYARLLEL